MVYYLSSVECQVLRGPFECSDVELHTINRRKVLLVRISPALTGLDFGLGLVGLKKVFLLAKYSDKELVKLKNFPISVHVILPENPVNPLIVSKKWSELINAGWAELYNSEENATQAAKTGRIISSI